MPERRRPEMAKRELGITLYNLGAVLGRAGKRADALAALREAAGIVPASLVVEMATDPDLQPLQGDPELQAIVASAKSRAPAPAR